MSWTDERVEQLTKLWAEGLSASQIAAQLGGVSRNAVIGKVHRLNLPGRAKSGGSRTPRAKRPSAPRASTGFASSRASSSSMHSASTGATSATAARVMKTSQRHASGGAQAATAQHIEMDIQADEALYQRPIEDVVVPISKKLKLVELTENTCKWPVGDPMSDDFHFCGNDIGEAGPYCKYHSKLAYQNTNDRRKPK